MDVTAVLDMLENNWLNPFNSTQTDIVSLSTAAVATPGVLADMERDYKTGESAYQDFCKT